MLSLILKHMVSVLGYFFLNLYFNKEYFKIKMKPINTEQFQNPIITHICTSLTLLTWCINFNKNKLIGIY
jgi:hypothetical protein